MIALSVFLFTATFNIESVSLLDKIMVPFIYLCAAMCLAVGIYMCSPSGRKMSDKVSEISKREKEKTNAKLHKKADVIKYSLYKTVSRELPVLAILILFFAIGQLTALHILLTAWCVLLILDFAITFSLKNR